MFCGLTLMPLRSRENQAFYALPSELQVSEFAKKIGLDPVALLHAASDGLASVYNEAVPRSNPSSSAHELQVLRAANLSGISWLVHGFSTRAAGYSRVYGGRTLNLGFTPEDSPAAIKRNRAAFLRAAGALDSSDRHSRFWPLVSLHQIHSDLIWPVPDTVAGDDSAAPSPAVHCGDGLITDRPGLVLAIRTADCLPLLLVDRKRRVIGAFHAGWRGTVQRIAEKAVGEMRRWFGSEPEHLQAAIGPGVHACCYQVGEEVRERFRSQFAYADDLFTETKESDPIHERYPLLFLVRRAPGHIEPFLPVCIRLDLVEANRRQLLTAGLRPRNISASPLCTCCRTDLLFSHRAEKGVTGRMMAVIAIKP